MSNRYQAGYRAALEEVARQARVDAGHARLVGAGQALNALADSIERWTPDPDPEAVAPASTPAPAWEKHGPTYCATIDRAEVTVRQSAIDLQWYGAGWMYDRRVAGPVGPFATAPEAARAAVAALRAIVVPVVEGLARVPELEQP